MTLSRMITFVVFLFLLNDPRKVNLVWKIVLAHGLGIAAPFLVFLGNLVQTFLVAKIHQSTFATTFGRPAGFTCHAPGRLPAIGDQLLGNLGPRNLLHVDLRMRLFDFINDTVNLAWRKHLNRM